MVPMCLLYWQNHKCVRKLRSLLVAQQDKVASLEAEAGILIRIFAVCGMVLSVLSMMIYLLQFAQQEKVASLAVCSAGESCQPRDWSCQTETAVPWTCAWCPRSQGWHCSQSVRNRVRMIHKKMDWTNSFILCHLHLLNQYKFWSSYLSNFQVSLKICLNVTFKQSRQIDGVQFCDGHVVVNQSSLHRITLDSLNVAAHTHTHTQPFYCSSGICPGPPGWADTRKLKPGRLKPIWIYWNRR